ncbi:hypothetical protein ACTDI4_16580 [Mesorhizobium sp. PUT5]|uniref:hypothetical protein n=1 Tax=Mesorhizobium sp. PUT5 TaxID=3454629 RepID=UPI003FA492D7
MTNTAKDDAAMPRHADRSSTGPFGDPAVAARKVGRHLAAVLHLAAAPTFAAMALLAAASGGAPDMCSSGPTASPLSGMAAMYLLMGVFHSAPWLDLMVGRSRPAEPRGRRKPPDVTARNATL